MKGTASSSSDNSLNSATSETPFNIIPEPTYDQEGTTYFLLDVDSETPREERQPSTSPPPPPSPSPPLPPSLPTPPKSKRHKSKKNYSGSEQDDNSSTSSTDSSSSSVSAQVVIDHGSSIPRRMEKNGASHLLRSADDESESDYAFCYTPARHESDADSATLQQNQHRLLSSTEHHTSSHLHTMEISSSHSQQDTDLSAAENDGKDDLNKDQLQRKSIPKSNMADKRIDDIHASETNGRSSDLRNHNQSNRKRRRHHRHHRNGKSTTEGNRKEMLANNKAMVTVYTEEDDDLMDAMPRGDRERIMRHNERNYRRNVSAGYRPRRLHKRTQRVLQTNLQSHSWSRRESQQSSRHPGLSSEDALRYFFLFIVSTTGNSFTNDILYSKLLYLANHIIAEERARIDKTIGKTVKHICQLA